MKPLAFDHARYPLSAESAGSDGSEGFKPSGEVVEARYKYLAQAALTIVYLRRPTDSHTSIMLPKVGVTLFNWRYFSTTN